MDDQWLVREEAFRPGILRAQESVFTIGNGLLATRGAFEEGVTGDQPATLIHGVFDDVPIVLTELANAPNWLPLVPFLGEESLALDRGDLLAYERTLNLQNGELIRTVRWRSPAGKTLEVRFERFTSLVDPHVLVIRCRLTALDFSGPVSLRAVLDGRVDNAGVPHWNKVEQGAPDSQTIYLESITRHTGILLCEAAHLRVDGADVQYATEQVENAPAVVARWTAREGRTVTAEKIVTLFTARDGGRDARVAALERLAALTPAGPGYDGLLQASAAEWARYWATSDVVIDGDPGAQVATRYNIFQLLSAGPRDDEYVSIAAKTLSGFGYRGHVFWDTEIFILPFFTFTQPAIARNLLLYRYHTLGGARNKAREAGLAGAQFAWESATTGDEVTPKVVPGPDGRDVRIWTGDIEIHISADVAYGVWQYWQITGDDDFLTRYGAEMILDTARFWGTRAEWNATRGRYELCEVIGPDEYHEHVDNNFFTNYLMQWHLRLALSTLDWLQAHAPGKAGELVARLELTPDTLAHWRDIIAKTYIGRAPNSLVFEQFEGYFARRDVDLAAMEPRGKSVQALLGIEGTNRTQVLKQPDVLMLFYLLPGEFDGATIQANWDYYTPRTDLTHGSSLAPGIQAILACRMGDPAMAYPLYLQAAEVDLKNLRLNTDAGLHGATAGSVWQAAALGFGGLHLTAEGLVAEPRLPAAWRRLRFTVIYRGEKRTFDFTNPKPA